MRSPEDSPSEQPGEVQLACLIADHEESRYNHLLAIQMTALDALGANSFCCPGPLLYYHYECDGMRDVGWGCGYRTAQTMLSYLRLNISPTKSRQQDSHWHLREPSIAEIQELLNTSLDASGPRRQSKDWIGTMDVCCLLDIVADTPCRILPFATGSDICSPETVKMLCRHMREQGTPIMIGLSCE